MKHVYDFTEGNKGMKDLLGGKGANLAEMSSLQIPVPPGFTITTEACAYFSTHHAWPAGLQEEVDAHISALERKMQAKFGDARDPLLVSVRSGAAASMPGMMDTVLNLGMNDAAAQGLIAKTNNPRFVYDSYRRFLQMFGDVVLDISHEEFEHALAELKKQKGKKFDTDLTADDLRSLVETYQSIYRKAGKSFPQHAREQLTLAINAVFRSWDNPRAVTYRRLNDIRGLKGTAVNVQSMVYGNMGESSGTGVLFSRNPSTGEKKLYGEYLMNAQGEDVVAGIRTPHPIDDLQKEYPQMYRQILDITAKLEQHYKDMQDMEFTIQEGRLFFLQTRNGKRTAHAAVKIAVDMVREKLIDEKTALLRIPASSLDQLLHKQLDPAAKKKAKLIARGLPASPGAAVGEVVLTAQKAHDEAQAGKPVILVRTETSPEDIEGMHAAQGILTARGGMTSHAAVVARGMGKCCVAGCSDIMVYEKEGKFTTKDGVEVKEGDFITLDGSLGEVMLGKVAVVDPQLSGDFTELMRWADSNRVLKVRANAETPHDAAVARKFGAEGIGLCRTEHMFFEESRIKAVREMILAADEAGRRKALAKILPMQVKDFTELFEIMDGFAVTIRLLDPPLHEFLPQEEEDIHELAHEMGVSIQAVRNKITDLHEFNPMLGHRGCRLAVTYPEIAEMQTEAIISAALSLKKKGKDIVPEIMVPLVGHPKELEMLKEIIDRKAQELITRSGTALSYSVGTMIEVPRGALAADKIAQHAAFFSFGTNDLTQMGFGFSRDDAGKFLKQYVDKNILEHDPFQTLDTEGIGQLMEIAIQKGKSARKEIKLGICGEHGGDPASIMFCHKIGLHYVSCSPFRVPIARLAAAQAALQ